MEQSKSNKTESSINQFINDYSNYSSEQATERLKDSVCKIKDFFLVILLYTLISVLFFAVASIIIYLLSKSAFVSISLFIFFIPVIMAISLFGVGRAISNLVAGINVVSDYMLELVALYYKEQLKNCEKEIPPVYITVQVLSTNLILPAIKSKISGVLLGRLITFSISKAVRKLGIRIQRETGDGILQGAQVSHYPDNTDNTERIENILTKINSIRNTSAEKSKKYLKTFKVTINIASVLCVVIGLPLVASLASMLYALWMVLYMH